MILERFGGDCLHTLTLDPTLVCNPIFISLQAGQQKRFTSLRNASDFSHTHWKSPESTIKPCIIALGVSRITGAGNKMQTEGLVGTFQMELTCLANITLLDQPNARQDNPPAASKSSHPRVQDLRQRPFFSHRYHDFGKGCAIHTRQLLKLVAKGNDN
jgi:hypothetical protein